MIGDYDFDYMLKYLIMIMIIITMSDYGYDCNTQKELIVAAA